MDVDVDVDVDVIANVNVVWSCLSRDETMKKE